MQERENELDYDEYVAAQADEDEDDDYHWEPSNLTILVAIAFFGTAVLANTTDNPSAAGLWMLSSIFIGPLFLLCSTVEAWDWYKSSR